MLNILGKQFSEEVTVVPMLTSEVNNVRGAAIPNNPLRVLSHALPVPSDSGHIYSTILERIGANTPSNPPTWINVFHAIPGKFNLPDIPTSPPSTPGPPSGSDGKAVPQECNASADSGSCELQTISLKRSSRALCRFPTIRTICPPCLERLDLSYRLPP